MPAQSDLIYKVTIRKLNLHSVFIFTKDKINLIISKCISKKFPGAVEPNAQGCIFAHQIFGEQEREWRFSAPVILALVYTMPTNFWISSSSMDSKCQKGSNFILISVSCIYSCLHENKHFIIKKMFSWDEYIPWRGSARNFNLWVQDSDEI